MLHKHCIRVLALAPKEKWDGLRKLDNEKCIVLEGCLWPKTGKEIFSRYSRFPVQHRSENQNVSKLLVWSSVKWWYCAGCEKGSVLWPHETNIDSRWFVIWSLLGKIDLTINQRKTMWVDCQSGIFVATIVRCTYTRVSIAVAYGRSTSSEDITFVTKGVYWRLRWFDHYWEYPEYSEFDDMTMPLAKKCKVARRKESITGSDLNGAWTAGAVTNRINGEPGS